MPNIQVTPAKGLYQGKATSALPNGSISGAKCVNKNAATGDTTTLTAADSGKFIDIDPTSTAVVLPTAASGLHFSLAMNADFASVATTITAASSANWFIGGIATGDGTFKSVSNGTSNYIITFDANSVAGDRVDIVCDGTNWFVVGGFSQVSTGTAFSG